MWMVGAGVVVFFGFAINCLIEPRMPECIANDWEQLILAFLIVLGFGGARDIALRRMRYMTEIMEAAKKESKAKGILTNKIWIPGIGWCLVGALANNFCLRPFRNIFEFCQVGEVNWQYLLGILALLFAISGTREYLIFRKDKEILEENDGKLPEKD